MNVRAIGGHRELACHCEPRQRHQQRTDVGVHDANGASATANEVSDEINIETEAKERRAKATPTHTDVFSHRHALFPFVRRIEKRGNTHTTTWRSHGRLLWTVGLETPDPACEVPENCIDAAEIRHILPVYIRCSERMIVTEGNV